MEQKDDKDLVRSNPRVDAAIERGFRTGTIGHVLSSPLPKEREPLLLTWLNWHGGQWLVNEEDQIIAVWGCFCDECALFVSDFVCRSGISLIAQGAGDFTVRRVNDEEAQWQKQTTSVKDRLLEGRIAQLCADLSLRIAERVAEEVAKKVARQAK